MSPVSTPCPVVPPSSMLIFRGNRSQVFQQSLALAAYFSEPKNIEDFAGSQIRQFFFASASMYFFGS